MSLQIQFFIEGDILTLTSGDGLGQLAISEAGDLAINQERVPLQEMDRELLIRFFQGSVDLYERNHRLARIADQLARDGSAVAAAAVRSALRTLSSDEGQGMVDLDLLETAVENPGEVFGDVDGNLDEMIESLGDLADQLRESVPQLYELDWFLIE